MPRGRGTTHGAGRGASSSRDTLLAAVALQDHIARTMRIPGGPKQLPSTQPGANMTLAQHLGLIPRPPPLLTEAEWTEVHLKARIRQDSTSECPICREDFKQEPQVLLSCSHVFHRACLSSFERHARAKCCPLCRAVQYQKKVIADGAEAHRQRCATRIQAAVRGWLARRQYKELRKHCPPQDPRLKRAWAAEQLEDRSNKMIDEMDAARGDIDALFAELDASLAMSRAVCDQVDGPAARRLQERLQAEGLASVTGLPTSARTNDHSSSDRGASTSAAAGSSAAGASTSAASQGNQPLVRLPRDAASGIDWEVVVSRAKARAETVCPICIGHLRRRGDSGIAWLSCTHCFHLECITAFEAYELSAGGQPTCPVCRASYQRRCFG